MAFYKTQGILKNPKIGAAVLISLATGLAFTIRAPQTGLPPTGVITQRLETGSGVTVAYCTDLGGCSFSGSLIVEGSLTVGGNSVATFPYSSALIGSGAVLKESVIVLSNPSTLAVTGTTILSFKLRSFSGNLIGIKATSTTAGSGVTIDVNLGGDTALSTKLTIDEDETDSDTAAAAAVISTTADNKSASEAVVIDIDSCGSVVAGATCPKGLTLNLIWQATSFAY
jgi:hypothetical protein